MKIERLTELEMFRMAVQMAGATLSHETRIGAVTNPEDILFDRIIESHTAIQRAAGKLLGADRSTPH